MGRALAEATQLPLSQTASLRVLATEYNVFTSRPKPMRSFIAVVGHIVLALRWRIQRIGGRHRESHRTPLSGTTSDLCGSAIIKASVAERLSIVADRYS